MNIASLNHAVNATDVSLEQLAKDPKLSKEQKLAGLSQQFEAVLLRQILQSARKPMLKSKLSPDSTEKGIYDDMVSSQLADKISKSGTLGLAATLRQQLSRQLNTTPAPGTGATEPVKIP